MSGNETLTRPFDDGLVLAAPKVPLYDRVWFRLPVWSRLPIALVVGLALVYAVFVVSIVLWPVWFAGVVVGCAVWYFRHRNDPAPAQKPEAKPQLWFWTRGAQTLTDANLPGAAGTLRCSDGLGVFQIWSPFANGGTRSWIDPDATEVIAYGDVAGYAPFTATKPVTGSNRVLGALAGLGLPGDRAVSELRTRKTTDLVTQVGVAIETASGNEYKLLNLFSAAGKKPGCRAVSRALARQEAICRKLASTGASLDEHWQAAL
jgi:hypothetical protein